MGCPGLLKRASSRSSRISQPDSGGHSSFARGQASRPAGMSDSSFGKSTIAPMPKGEISWLRRMGLKAGMIQGC
jgi:hypothetical protein